MRFFGRLEKEPVFRYAPVTVFYGQVAELVDALASGASDRKVMRVQVPPCPP